MEIGYADCGGSDIGIDVEVQLPERLGSADYLTLISVLFGVGGVQLTQMVTSAFGKKSNGY